MQVDRVRVRDLRQRNRVRDRQERVEALADGPGEALALGFVLRVARGHVEGQQVGGDVGEDGGVVREVLEIWGVGGRVALGLGGGRVGADDEAELGFVVEGCALRAEDGGGVVWRR